MGQSNNKASSSNKKKRAAPAGNTTMNLPKREITLSQCCGRKIQRKIGRWDLARWRTSRWDLT